MFARTSRLLLGLAVLTACATAPAPRPATPAERMRDDVRYLASDALEGRFSGSPGARAAAQFIAERFRALGLRPAGADNGFMQTFSFISSVKPGPGNALSFEIAGRQREARFDDEFRPLAFSSSGSASGEVAFVGYGIRAKDLEYDDYAGIDVKGKIALVLRFSPEGDDPASKFQPFMALRRKASEARAAGAVAVLVATGPIGSKDTSPVKISFDASFADSGLPVFSISTALARELFAGHGFTLEELQERINTRKEAGSRPLGVTARLTASVEQVRADAANVLAMVPGADPKLKDEALIIGAHYDHLGWGGEGVNSLAPGVRAVHHGADDNASGTAAILEIARAFSARPPARTVLFAAFAGEEEGLLGSAHLVQHLPVAKEQVTAMINLDMVGRPKAGPVLTLGGYGTAAEWPALVERLNANHHLTLTTNKGGFGASDHSSFYSANLPVVFFFTGAHEDYHKPSDTADKLDYPAMAKVVGFAGDLARLIADLPQRPTFQKVADEGVGERRGFRVRTGVIPEYGYDGPGVKLSGVRGGSAAEKAGLKGGDIVVKFGARETRNIYDYMYALGDHKPGETVTVTVKRGDATLELLVTLEAGGGGGR